MPDTNSVIRYGRQNIAIRSAKANGEILAGDIVVPDDGADTVSQGTSSLTNDEAWGVAIDDRERGMEIGDSYADGDNVLYAVVSSGCGVNVNMEDGQTLSVDSENRLVMSSTDGRVRPFSGDNSEDTLLQSEETSDISASGSEEPVSATPV